MKSYKIHQNSLGSVIAVKDGFSWGAFLFGFIWAWFRKMWLIGIYVLMAAFGLSFFLGIFQANDFFINISAVIFQIIFGFFGNEFRSKKLVKNGYSFVANIESKNASNAAAQYMTNKLNKS